MNNFFEKSDISRSEAESIVFDTSYTSQGNEIHDIIPHYHDSIIILLPCIFERGCLLVLGGEEKDVRGRSVAPCPSLKGRITW